MIISRLAVASFSLLVMLSGLIRYLGTRARMVMARATEMSLCLVKVDLNLVRARATARAIMAETDWVRASEIRPVTMVVVRSRDLKIFLVEWVSRRMKRLRLRKPAKMLGWAVVP